MSNKLSIINRGLGFLGERPITNPDAPDTPAGRHLADHFDECRQEVLRRYAWNFAETWGTANLTAAPAFGYSDAYSYPPDCLRIIWVGTIDDQNRNYRLLKQGTERVIATENSGASTLKLAYTADVTSYALWDPLARKVFALWLALDGAKSITGKAEYVKVVNDLLAEELKDAIGVDGQEQPLLRHDYNSSVQAARDMAQYADSGFLRVEGYY